jgi:hypothetical protein
MRNKKQRGDLSVQAIAGTHVVLLGMDCAPLCSPTIPRSAGSPRRDLKDLVQREVGTFNGVEFQRAMKAKHLLAMEYIARLMRHTRMANGPLYKGTERSKLTPKVRGEEQSIYPWLSREAVAEFQAFLA